MKIPRAPSPLEELLALQIRAEKLPEPAREHRFHPVRKWRFDFSWAEPHMLAVEVEGGTFSQGRHTRGYGFEADAEKLNMASMLGWRVLRFTGAMIKRGDAITMIKLALNGESACR